jgi:hypothetical protein
MRLNFKMRACGRLSIRFANALRLARVFLTWLTALGFSPRKLQIANCKCASP